MTISFDAEFDALLQRHDPAVADLARQVVALIRDVRPDMAAKVQRGWGSVNFKHPKAGFICGVFPQVRESNVIVVFENGRLLDSPLLVDNGKVKRVRWIPFRLGETLPVDEIAILLAEAIALRA